MKRVIIASKTYWAGIYTDVVNRKHAIVFESDSHDYDEALDELDSIIPEPYASAKLVSHDTNSGLLISGLEKDGYDVNFVGE